MAREDNFDLINLDGPLSVEAILKTLQQRFMEGQCYVSCSIHPGFLVRRSSGLSVCEPTFVCVRENAYVHTCDCGEGEGVCVVCVCVCVCVGGEGEVEDG